MVQNDVEVAVLSRKDVFMQVVVEVPVDGDRGAALQAPDQHAMSMVIGARTQHVHTGMTDGAAPASHYAQHK